MMKTMLKFSMLLLLCLFKTGMLQAQTSHWQCNPYDWQYDMTVYVTVLKSGNPVSQLANYEIAAFCGDECRGVATVQTVEKDGDESVYGYLRIRSNQQSGESITFKVYDRQDEKELAVGNSPMIFQSQGVVGLPSNPLILNIVFLGDVNGDGDVDIADAVCIVNHVVDKPNTTFIEAVADANSDGDIDIADAVRIVNFVVGKIPALAPRRDRRSMLNPE